VFPANTARPGLRQLETPRSPSLKPQTTERSIQQERNEVLSRHYLKDVLLRVATHPQRLIAQLTPKGWAETFGRELAAV
jgi:hypothetical protein